MQEMSVKNGEKRRKNLNCDEKGRFCKGNKVAVGKRKRSQTDKLLEALKKEGEKQGINFWAKVAETAFKNKDIMKTVVNKLVPTVNELTGAGGEPISITLRKIIYGKEEKEGEKDRLGEAKT